MVSDVKQDQAISNSAAVGPVDGFLDFLARIGRTILTFLQIAGRLSLFVGESVSHIFRPPFFPKLILRQFMDIGYYSLPVVGMTALFTGMVLALQSYTGFARFNAESAVAGVVVL